MTNKEFCNNVLSLIGDSYETTDCIGVVRKAAHIRCQGTNWLYRSYNNSGKYRYLTERHEPTENPCSGTLVFRIKYGEIPKGYTDRPNCYHVGVVIGADVIQSNPDKGVYASKYRIDDWDCAGWLKFVDKPDEDDKPDPVPPDQPDLTDHEMIKAIYAKICGSID